MKDLTMFIKEVGFPIAAFIMMFWFATKSLKENTKAINELARELGGFKNNCYAMKRIKEEEDK